MEQEQTLKISAKSETQKSNTSAKPETNEYDNPNSPFYLHHSDQPGAVLVSQSLNEENYGTWSRAMIMALSAKNKEGFINGTIKGPSSTSFTDGQQWKRCNDLVKSWLLNSISHDIRGSVIYNETAHEIWADLKERFSRVNSVHLFHVEQAIHDTNQNNMSINTYYTRLKSLWDERDSMSSIPSCTCSAMKEVLQFQHNQKTMKFLMGLNESYASVRGQILLMDPLPAVNKAYSLVLQDEKQRAVSTGKALAHEAAAFAVKDNSRSSGRNFMPKNPHLKCGICDKVGHIAETCRAHLKCDYCGWNGHTIDVCRKLQKANSTSGKQDHLQDRRSFAPKANLVDSKASTPNSYTLTGEQYQNLMTLLGNSAPNPMANHVGSSSTVSDLSGMAFCASVVLDDRSWILDTGATDHMICNPNLLTTSVAVTHRTVHLPNGALAAVTHVGSIHFTDFVLHNVLCVPSFRLKLISISKLTRHSHCRAIFDDNICMFQDRQSGKMIGMGIERGGLYYLDTTHKTGCNSVTTTITHSSRLWHQRLGHLSNKSLHSISHSVKDMNFCNIDDCLICPLAKQTRSQFPLSSINTHAPFEIIHVDTWGGYHVPTITGARYFLTIVDDYTRCTWVYLMHHKSDTHQYLTTFINLVETQFSLKVKILRSDNGPEFKMSTFFSNKGIIHQTSCVSTPQQNGVAERKHRHLLNVARALLFQASLPKKILGRCHINCHIPHQPYSYSNTQRQSTF